MLARSLTHSLTWWSGSLRPVVCFNGRLAQFNHVQVHPDETYEAYTKGRVQDECEDDNGERICNITKTIIINP